MTNSFPLSRISNASITIQNDEEDVVIAPSMNKENKNLRTMIIIEKPITETQLKEMTDLILDEEAKTGLDIHD